MGPLGHFPCPEITQVTVRKSVNHQLNAVKLNALAASNRTKEPKVQQSTLTV